MIEIGGLTVIKFKTYSCLEIDDEGYAHLKDVTTTQGRPMKMKALLVPYFKDGKFITPEPEPVEAYKMNTTFSLRKIANSETDLSISHGAIRLLKEWTDTAIRNMVANAERNAVIRGKDTIEAAHFFWLETNMQVEGYWPDNNEYSKKEK
mgnify:FL=1|tara:strand:- start:330 stop:779 length:450 start_codon:yes stop_codon:yes gene_type:complete